MCRLIHVLQSYTVIAISLVTSNKKILTHLPPFNFPMVSMLIPVAHIKRLGILYDTGSVNDQPPAPVLIQIAAMITRMTTIAIAIQITRLDDSISPAISLAIAAMNLLSEAGL
jgi:hypothetical protein